MSEHPYPQKVLEALSDLSIALLECGLKMTSVDIQRDARPLVQEYTVHTAGGAVNIKHRFV